MKARRSLEDEDGAITVDWVVLTGAIIGLSIGMAAMLADGSRNVGDTVDGKLTDIADRVEAGTIMD